MLLWPLQPRNKKADLGTLASTPPNESLASASGASVLTLVVDLITSEALGDQAASTEKDIF